MKTKFLLPFVLLALALSSCIKNKNLKTFTLTRPSYSIKQDVKNNARLQKAEPLKDLGSFALYNNMMFINEKDKGIHVIDYSAPTNPVNRGFIPIPGNQGLSIKNNILYADCYCDLFVFRIITGEKIELQNSVSNIFEMRYNYDTLAVQQTWTSKDTTVTEDYYNQTMRNEDGLKYDAAMLSSQSNVGPRTGGGTSVGSSMSVFTIVNDHLYTVDNLKLSTFSLQDALNPALTSRQEVGWNVETIFPFKDKLFIGSMTGMFIYSIENPAAPAYQGQFNHVRVCDPVIADDTHAFVTLRGGSRCGGFTNQMDVLDIGNITDPKLVLSMPFSNPHGLSKDNNVLFVCDGSSGVKVVDASDITNMKVQQTIYTSSKAIDVVALNKKAFVMLEDAIRIYSYDQQFNIQLLGSITKN